MLVKVKKYMFRFIIDILKDRDLIDIFKKFKYLKNNYGFGLDEGVVEYPWVFSRMFNVLKKNVKI